MENVVANAQSSGITGLFSGVYKGKTVLITGNTGFKGSWMAYWLYRMDAIVVGYSLAPPTAPSHWQLLDLPVQYQEADIRDVAALQSALDAHRPDIIFHLAAQPLVRYSYQHPLETIQTNILGTANVLDCVRRCSSVQAVVIVTSDKCYENPEDGKPLTEGSPMGGYDPYSMSKGAAELVTSSYRNAYFNPARYGYSHQTLVASVRAGNVIGGGDWAADRLIPDLIRGSVLRQPVVIRNPEAVRPWQHVLEPLSGYLLVGQRLLEKDVSVAEGWNFGPALLDAVPVRTVTEQARQVWPILEYLETPSAANLHEAHLLSLDCQKAEQRLNWRPIWSMPVAVDKTIGWYRAYYEQNNVLSELDLNHYISDAKTQKSVWTTPRLTN